MAKFYGPIGFVQTVEEPPNSGNWVPTTIERKYYGELIGRNVQNETSDKVNDDFNISNDISIVADSYLLNNTHLMRYVTYLGVKWKIRSISISFPRVELSVGGIYND